MNLLKLWMIAIVVLIFALGSGLIKKGLTMQTLDRYAKQSVGRCMQGAGYSHIYDMNLLIGDEQEITPEYEQLMSCWSVAANTKRFDRLHLIDPVAERSEQRIRGIKHWKCVEREGYELLTKIPLNGRDGYPLQIAAGNFRVGSSDRALNDFYATAAKCSGDKLETYKWSNGTFSRDPADGTTRCMQHSHGGSGEHGHGCYWLSSTKSGAALKGHRTMSKEVQ